MATSKKLRIALAQKNFCVGDISGNSQIIVESIAEARDKLHADIIIFPELALTAYPPEDLLYRSELYVQSDYALESIIKAGIDIAVILGHAVHKDNKRFNAASLIRNGKIEMTYFKQELPNYSVFDEKRYFSEGTEPGIFTINDITVSISICEDIWVDRVCKQASENGAQLMVNINASPFHINKQQLRKNTLQQRVKESGLNIVYVNQFGGQDELVFDGGSMAINNQGEIQYESPQFCEGIYSTEFTGSTSGSFTSGAPGIIQEIHREESIYLALETGVRDYVRKNGFSGALIGLSGGIDSALTLAIAVDALGKENVEAVTMPSRYTSTMSTDDSVEMASLLGIKLHNISIEKPFMAFTEVLEPVFKNLPADITEENIQARCRGVLLMAISNKTRKLVLTTGNKSEMAVGYATLYGDMSGGFAPLKDISKTLVYKLSDWRNQQSKVIPQRIIDRPPTAELRENQLDQDSLPPYEILDPILERYIEQDQSPAIIIQAGYDEEDVKKVVLLIDRNEYKRRQAAPGVRITQRAFGRDRRYPITSGYRE